MVDFGYVIALAWQISKKNSFLVTSLHRDILLSIFFSRLMYMPAQVVINQLVWSLVIVTYSHKLLYGDIFFIQE